MTDTPVFPGRTGESAMAWAAVAVIGGLIAADGIGSILVRSGQYHGPLFDAERGIRAFAGFALFALAVSQMQK
jgi:hypothetical protein